MLKEIYTSLKATFQGRRDALISEDPIKGYVPPEELDESEFEQIVKDTNQLMADAAENNIQEEIAAASKKSNLLLGMARDNYGAQSTRLTGCRNYLLYMQRALHEADQEDPEASDGMLSASIRRV